MALFGVPDADERHAINACLAGLEIARAVERLPNQKMQARVGVNSGEVVIRLIAGEMGASYDATGATVHLANRMETSARPGTVLVSAATYTLAAPYFDFVSESPAIAKGFNRPIPVYSISGHRSISRWLARAGEGMSLFVGRQSDLQLLRNLAEQVKGGEGHFVLISAEAGIGKSRLVHNFMAEIADDGWSFMEGESAPIGQSTPYGALKRLLLSWIGRTEIDAPAVVSASFDQHLSALGSSVQASFMAALRSVLDLHVADVAWRESEPGFRRRQIIDAFKFVIQRTTTAVPLVLLLEDLHWIDPESATAILSLYDILPRHHLLLLGTTRPRPQNPLRMPTRQTFIELAPLDTLAAAQLLDSLLGKGTGLSKLKERLLNASGGIPLFIEELVRRLIDTGALVGSHAAYVLTVPPEQIGIPPSVRAIIATRVDVLAKWQKRVLQCAAVLGVPFTVDLLTEMSELSSEKVLQASGLLEDARFLSPVRVKPNTELAFSHELVREVVYSALVRDERRALHGKALAACMKLSSDRLNELAGRLSHHAYESQEWELVVRFARQSAVRAIERSAFNEAAAQFQRAIEATSRLSRSRSLDEIAIDVRLQSRLAFSATSQLTLWIEYAKEAEQMASAIGDERRELTAIINRAQALNFAGPPSQSIEIVEPALKRAMDAHLDDLQVIACYTLGQAQYARGHYRKTIDLLSQQLSGLRGEHVLVRFGTAGTTSVLFLTMIGLASSAMGELSESSSILEEAFSIAQKTGRPYDLVACGYGRGVLYSYSGCTKNAIDELRVASDVCREHSINLFIPLIVAQLGAALVDAGSYEQAVELLEKGIQEAQGLGHRVATVAAMHALAAAYKALGRVGPSIELGQRALEIAKQYEFIGVQIRLLRLLGMLETTHGDGDVNRAEELVASSIELAKTLGSLPNVASGKLAMAEIRLKSGEQERALQLMDSAIADYEHMGCNLLADQVRKRRSGSLTIKLDDSSSVDTSALLTPAERPAFG
jgi:tetratricopeptide (TPR) repeat protein